jgi:O-antigen/teichoic acid export membrane protein
MTRLSTNFVANFFGRIAGSLLLYVFTPLYIAILGVEAYGLIGFYAALLGVCSFADAGLTALLGREMARCGAREHMDGRSQRNLVRTVETIYLLPAGGVALAIYCGSRLLGDHWLTVDALDPLVVRRSIQLMGLAIALHLPAFMYHGGLSGLERQLVSNGVQVSIGLLRGVGGVLVLVFLSSTVTAFFTWQVLVNLLHLMATRALLVHQLPKSRERARFDAGMMRGVWRYAAGIAAISLSSMVLLQADKLVVSNLLSLTEFGYYGIAVAFATVPSAFSQPISAAVFPRLTRLYAAGNEAGLGSLYHRASQFSAAVVLPIGVTMTMFSWEIISFWTASPRNADKTSLVAGLLVIGSTFLALQVLPHTLALSSAWTRLGLGVAVISGVFYVPAAMVLVGMMGLVGAGVAWVALNLVNFTVYTALLHRRLVRGQLARWYLSTLGRPALATLICVGSIRIMVPFQVSGWRGAVAAALAAATALVVSVAVSPDCVRWLFDRFTWLGTNRMATRSAKEAGSSMP